MAKKLLLILFVFAFGQKNARAQNTSSESKPDSLLKLLQVCKEDSNKVNLQNNLAKYWLQKRNYDSAFVYSEDALDLAKHIKFTRGIVQALNNRAATEEGLGNFSVAIENYNEVLKLMFDVHNEHAMSVCYHNIAVAYMNNLNHPAALKNYFAALKIKKELLKQALANRNKDDSDFVSTKQKDVAATLNGIGNTYKDLGNYSEALSNYLESLKLAEEMGSKYGIALLSNNIGIIYKEQSNFNEALKYYFAAVKIKEELGQTNDAHYANMINNIGNVYIDQDKLEEAIKNFLTSLKIREAMGDKKGIANCYHSLGNVYNRQGKNDLAMEKYNMAFKLRTEIEDKVGLVASYIDIGDVYASMDKSTEAFDYITKGLNLALQIRHLEWTKNAYSNLSRLDSVVAAKYAQSGKWKEASEYFSKAFSNYRMYILYRDSLLSDENTKNVVRVQMAYEFNKIETATQEQQAISKLELEIKERQRNYLIVGFILSILIALFIFRNHNQKQKLKQIIAEQKKAEEDRIDTTRRT